MKKFTELLGNRILNLPRKVIRLYFTPTEKVNLTQKSFLNASTAILDYSAQIGVRLILTPILVTGLGPTIYGIWEILRRTIGFLTFADGRPSQSLKWLVANRQHQIDSDVKRREVGSALIIWFLFLPVLIICGVIFIWLSPKFTGASQNHILHVRLTAAILTFMLIISGVTGLSEAVLRGSNLGYKRIGIVFLLYIFEAIGMAVCVYIGFGLIGLATAKLLTTMLGGVLFWVITKKTVSWFGLSKPFKKEIRRFFGFNFNYLLWTFISSAMGSLDVLILGIILTPNLVTDYSLSAYATQFVSGLTLILIGAIMPSLGGIVGDGKNEEILKVRSEMITYIWLMITTFGSLIIIFNQSFIRLWVGSQHFVGVLENLLIVLIMIQWVFIINDARIIDLNLKLRKKVLYGFLSLIISITLALILTSRFGLLGLCLGILIGRIPLSIAYPSIIDSMFGGILNIRNIARIRKVLITFSILFISVILGEIINISNWILFLICLFFSFMGLFVLLFFVGFTPNQRKDLFKRLDSLELTNFSTITLGDE